MRYPQAKVIIGDCLDILPTIPDGSVHTCVTSPPYWGLRDYGVDGQMGLEPTPEEYVSKMVAVFREVRRVLRDDGTLWLNLGDSYVAGGGDRKNGSQGATSVVGHTAPEANPDKRGKQPHKIGLKPKDLVGIPWRVAFALQADGWYLRSDIIWHKPNPMPESVLDRPTRSHEFVFLLSKNDLYFYDCDAVREPYAEDSIDRYNYAMMGVAPQARQINGDVSRREREKGVRPMNPLGRNRRDVWTVPSEPFRESHFATFPPKLVEPCIMAGCPPGGTVLDPFAGSGTTGKVALEHGRSAILIELNPKYLPLINQRLSVTPPLFYGP